MKTKPIKIIFDTVHFMITLILIALIIVLWTKLNDTKETIDILTILYSNLRAGVSSNLYF